jgi:hypothetical protein
VDVPDTAAGDERAERRREAMVSQTLIALGYEAVVWPEGEEASVARGAIHAYLLLDVAGNDVMYQTPFERRQRARSGRDEQQ